MKREARYSEVLIAGEFMNTTKLCLLAVCTALVSTHLIIPAAPALAVATPRIASACAGDCDDNGAVTVDELVKGVNIALGSLSLDQCPRFDCRGTGQVGIDCLIQAVDAAQDGCTAEPTISPTSTRAVTDTAMPTATPPAASTPINTPTATTTQAAPTATEPPTATPTPTTTPAPCGRFVTIWGGLGSGAGQFNFPSGVAVTGDGHVLVVDAGNNRIEEFTNDGVFVATFGSGGTGNGQFDAPAGIAVDGDDNVFVADTNNSRIQKFTRAGAFLTKWGSPGNGDGQFSGPVAVAVDAGGIARGTVYVADRFNNRIQVFTDTGRFLFTWGTVGSADGQFASPIGVAADHLGHVFVTDFFNDRVQDFTNGGNFLGKWGGTGSKDGQLSGPMGIAVDRAVNVSASAGVLMFVVDDGNDRIEEFTGTGQFVTTWGSLGDRPGQFNSPVGIAVDADRNVFVSDEGHHVQKFACP